MNSLHAWLGKDFRELIPCFREEVREIRFSLTRPYAHSYGKGRMRVVRVLDTPQKMELLFAYEHYDSPPRPKKSSRKKKKVKAELAP